jgi:hypothetical protein
LAAVLSSTYGLETPADAHLIGRFCIAVLISLGIPGLIPLRIPDLVALLVPGLISLGIAVLVTVGIPDLIPLRIPDLVALLVSFLISLGIAILISGFISHVILGRRVGSPNCPAARSGGSLRNGSDGYRLARSGSGRHERATDPRRWCPS